jgi:hypothetical protein
VGTSIDIQKYRLTFFRTETHRSLFATTARTDFPLGFIGSRPHYAAAFEAIRGGGNPAAGFTTPWEDPTGHHYWEYYLNGEDIALMSGDQAWKYAVPLRAALPVAIATPDPGDRVHAEGFLYPFGIAVALTLVSQTVRPLEEAIDHAIDFKTKPQLTMRWSGADAAQEHEATLSAAIDECMAYMRRTVFGAAAQPDRRSSIFSLFTVVKGAGPDVANVPPQDGDVHRALNAVTNWPPDWRASHLPALDATVRPALDSSDPDSHIVYAGRNGRAVWFPTLFASAKPRRGATCYHRNITLASMQTAGLATFATATAEVVEEGEWATLPAMHHDCARLAAGLLGRIYGKTRETYRSKGLRYLIDQNDFVQPINALRKQLGMGELA